MRNLVLAAALLWPQLALAQTRYVRGVRVTVAPPALRTEVRTAAPSPRHRWIAGYWGWRGGKTIWLAGHWAIPPTPGYVWEPAHWENEGGAWIFYEGYWRISDQPDPQVVYQPPPPPVQPVVIEAQPPAPIEEVRPAAPFEGAVWIPGYWQWNGVRHVWVAGRWSPQPRDYRWENHGWEKRRDGRWEHRPGHWEHREERGEHHGHWDHDRGDHDRD
jgi:hypothetical protein